MFTIFHLSQYGEVLQKYTNLTNLCYQVSSSALDKATSGLEGLLRVCAAPVTGEEIKEAQNRAMHDTIRELVRQVTSPNTLVRQQAMDSLRVRRLLFRHCLFQLLVYWPYVDVKWCGQFSPL